MTNVILPKETYVDLYSETGIPVGTQILVLNMTPNTVRLFSTAGTPVQTDNNIPLPFRAGNAVNDTGDQGAWAFSVSGGAVDVLEVT